LQSNKLSLSLSEEESLKKLASDLTEEVAQGCALYSALKGRQNMSKLAKRLLKIITIFFYIPF
jgi:hypothetical protein